MEIEDFVCSAGAQRSCALNLEWHLVHREAEVAQHDVVWQINALMPTVCSHQQHAANAIPVKEGVHELSHPRPNEKHFQIQVLTDRGSQTDQNDFSFAGNVG